MIVKYDPALADLILDRMAEGEGMDAICADSQMPPRRIVRRWLVLVPEFAAKFAVARDLQAESVGDEIIAIEAKVLSGDLTPSQASTAIASKQWRMERLCPKRWGRKVEQTVQMNVDPRDLSDAQLAAFISGATDPGLGIAGTTRAPTVPGKSH